MGRREMGLLTIVDERLLLLDSITLNKGGHDSFDAGHCALETVAWLAGEPHSDNPVCVSPVVGAFVRSWNDSLHFDEERDRLLKPLLPLMIGTATTKRDETTRAWMATDWLVREQAPAWLRLAGLDEHAQALESLAALKGRVSAVKAQPTIDAAGAAAGAAARDAAGAAAGAAARDAAGAAAGAAARDAAGDAAWAVAREAARDAARAAARDAARAAARDAAGDAAWVAAWDAARDAVRAVVWDAARAAAGDAAWVAAWDAAWDAARDALEPTVQLLQQSAVLLVTRMCDVGRNR